MTRVDVGRRGTPRGRQDRTAVLSPRRWRPRPDNAPPQSTPDVQTVVGRERAGVHRDPGGREPGSELFARQLELALRRTDGVGLAEVNANLGRVVVAFDEDRTSVERIVDAIEGLEACHGNETLGFPHDRPEHPGDIEPLRRQVVAIGADILGAGVSTLRRALRIAGLPEDVGLLLTLVDSTPRIRQEVSRDWESPRLTLPSRSRRPPRRGCRRARWVCSSTPRCALVWLSRPRGVVKSGAGANRNSTSFAESLPRRWPRPTDTAVAARPGGALRGQGRHCVAPWIGRHAPRHGRPQTCTHRPCRWGAESGQDGEGELRGLARR